MSAALDLLKDYQLFYSHYFKKNFLEEFPEYLTVQGNDLQEWDKEVIRHYTGQGYLQLNRHLREAIKTDYTVSYKNILNHALDKLPSYHGIAYRGVSSKKTIDVEARYKVNDVINFTTFSSASLNFDTAMSFIKKAKKTNLLFQISSENGKLISQYSTISKEEEVLFKSDSSFKILSLSFNSKKNIHNIIMEEISNATKQN